MSRTRLAIALCLLAASMAPAHAQWIWRDAAGQTHISDLPPPKGTPERNIVQRPAAQARLAPPPAPAASAAASAPNGVDPALEARRKKQAEDQKAEAQAQRKAQDEKNAAVRADNCQRARDQLRTLESGQRMQRIAPNGEREIIDDAQRASETQRVRGIIATVCA
jgi:hypothetical protein